MERNNVDATVTTGCSVLQFAYAAAKRISFTATQISFLREIVSRYGKAGTQDDAKTALEILEEARQMQLELIHRHRYEFVLDYPSLALDFSALNRHDLAMEIISESIRVAGELRQNYHAAMLVAVAEVCHAVGEVDRCREVLDAVEPYLQSRRRFQTIRDEFAGKLVSLNLRLGKFENARAIAERMTGLGRSEALAELAFADPSNCIDEYLGGGSAIRKEGWVRPYYASLMGSNNQPDRAREMIARIGKRNVTSGAMLDLAFHLFQHGDVNGAADVIRELCPLNDFDLEFHAVQLEQLLPPLTNNHSDLVRVLLQKFRTEVERHRQDRDRLAGLAKLVRLLAVFSPQEAEDLIDELVEILFAYFESSADAPKVFFNMTVPVVLYSMAMDIDRHGLRFDRGRREQFRELLEAFPVQQYRDLRTRDAKRLVGEYAV